MYRYNWSPDETSEYFTTLMSANHISFANASLEKDAIQRYETYVPYRRTSIITTESRGEQSGSRERLTPTSLPYFI